MGDGQSSFAKNFQAKEIVGRLIKSPTGSTLQETVIVFDWDDTLLCTSSILKHKWSAEDLSELQDTVKALLSEALLLGEVLIVTNGVATWVADTAEKFFPGLKPLLERTKIISARSLYEDRFPSDPFAWKRHTFNDIFAPRKDTCPRGINLIVMGDSAAEIEAAIHTADILGPSSKVKTLKFVENPGVNELMGQLRRVTQNLGSIVSDGRSNNYKLLRHCHTNFAAVNSWDIVGNVPSPKRCQGPGVVRSSTPNTSKLVASF